MTRGGEKRQRRRREDEKHLHTAAKYNTIQSVISQLSTPLGSVSSDSWVGGEGAQEDYYNQVIIM